MSDISLKLEQRTAEGKKLAALRKSGFVPSIVYGGKDKPFMSQSPAIDTVKVVKAAGKHSPVNIVVDGKKKLAIIKTIDVDPVKHSLRHLAFHTIKQNEVITTEVAIILTGEGESPAERAGLVVLQALEKIEVKAKPADLPESLEVSITGLETTEDKITVGDIKLPDGVEFADQEQSMDQVIANVYEPSALQAANEAAGGTAEPEDEENVPSEEGAAPAEGEKPAEGSEKPETEANQ